MKKNKLRKMVVALVGVCILSSSISTYAAEWTVENTTTSRSGLGYEIQPYNVKNFNGQYRTSVDAFDNYNSSGPHDYDVSLWKNPGELAQAKVLTSKNTVTKKTFGRN